MTVQDFNNILKEKEIFYLYFYSPTCLVCKKITLLLSTLKHPIHPIDGDKHEKISNVFEIEYYPSLVEIKNKSATLYSGSKHIKTLIKKLES